MKTPYGTPQVKSPDWTKIQRAVAPGLAAASPALSVPVANANQILNKQVATLSRAGSNPGNPILAGLGVRIQIVMGVGDRLLGLYLFQDNMGRGANLVSEASVAGQIGTFDFMAGSGRSVAGSPATGAVRNFIRWQTEAGAEEREVWIKSYDADIVTAKGQACLDDDTLLPVEIPLTVVATSDWIPVDVDFMSSWNDEFQVLARGDGSQQAEAGFKKAYGGALWVSFFDKEPGTEGVGVQVNPLTKVAIASRRQIQIENTAGLKEITARFRSEADSIFFVDIPLKFIVTAPEEETCAPPFSEPCTEVYLKSGTDCPEDCPDEASEPDVQVVAGTPGDPLAQDLLVVTMHGTIAGPTPKLRVTKYKWIANAQALAGATLEQIGEPEDYKPLVLSGDSPVEALPYGDPHRLTMAFSVVQLRNDLVAHMDIVVLDGDHVSSPVSITGPRARDIGTLPIGGLGGGEICEY